MPHPYALALPSLSPARVAAFRKALFAMHWENPKHRHLMELEVLKQWMPPREEGYTTLRQALDEEGTW